jgi:PAS domain S-box-containing protein
MTRELFDGLDIAVVATDNDCVISYWNSTAAGLLGWQADEVIGHHLSDYLQHTPGGDQVEELVSKTTGWPTQFDGRRSHGDPITVRSTSSSIKTENGDIVGTVAFLSEAGPGAGDRGQDDAGQSVSRSPISVVIATDSLLIGDGLVSLFAEGNEVTVLGRVRNCLELVNLCRKVEPQAVIISIRAGDDSSLLTVTAGRHLRTEYPDLGIVLVSDCGTEFALELLRDGSSRLAYLLDDHLPTMDTILSSLREVVAGQSVLDPTIVDFLIKHHRATIDELSDRESRVLELMAEGLSNRAIAERLSMSVKSIEKCISAIFRNLELNDRSGVDRRVTATLNFQRARSERLEYESSREPATH